MGDVFLEIIVNADEAAEAGIESRDEIEEPLEGALSAVALGEVTGGGGGSGVYVIDIELSEQRQFEEGLRVIRGVLQSLRVPASTVIKKRQPEEMTLPVYT